MRLRVALVSRFLILVFVLAWGNTADLFAADPPAAYTTPEAVAADPDFALQGEYTGIGTGVQIVAQGKGQFLAVIYRGGLPGAGWNGTDRQETDEDANAVRDLIKDLSLKKVERKSPTLGSKPPPGAVALFDGQEASLSKHWQAGTKLDNGTLQQGATSLDKFTDFVIHLEFRTPYMPAARGQGRGNSGVYYQGRYESQITDSFGLEANDHECGGFYNIKAPELNMCLPPLSWQTYDTEFTAARWDKTGKKIANARVTVRLNGIVIQQDLELPGATLAAPVPEGPEAGPINLQDHGNPVRYRNVWVLPRNIELEARRPIIPGFERFYAATGADPAEGGRLLLGELNCIACHQPDDALARQIAPRQSPILDDIGQRAHPEYLLKFLAAPHQVKPGTPMPSVLSTLPEAERPAVALALVNFLVGPQSLPEQSSDLPAFQRGEKLFKEIGCLACHLSNGPEKVASKSAIPLGDLGQKYSIPSLAAFLKEPHKSRPAGRMPNLLQQDQDAIDLANYLIGNVDYKPRNPNFRFAAYHGNWNNVPKFEELKPVKVGECAGFNMSLAGRTGDFGLRFDGFLKIDQEGDYTFHLGSDDGSVLTIDGKKVTDSDGVHPHTVNTGRARLTKGMHPLRVEYFQGGGEATLTLEYEGPSTPRQDINRSVFLTQKGPDPKPANESDAGFQFDQALADKGRQYFATLGCASCHQFKQNGEPVKAITASPLKPLKELKPGQGCLAESGQSGAATVATNTASSGKPVPNIPQFDLDGHQRVALNAALTTAAPTEPITPQRAISMTMTAFNCYACHVRGEVGGPERSRNALFRTTIPEMGDEGRIPPPLDGVADKLTTEWLRHVLQDGTKDRPYMLTRMPKFGLPKVDELVEAFVAVDRKTGTPAAKVAEAEHRVKAVGRQLVGDKALGCIKCHTFGPHRASGIQAINLQSMTQRVREDWFLRYMIDPPAYRPGTRMPTGFPGGKATIRDVYDGDTDRQLASIWTYLKDGTKAGIPEGLIANVIELKPATRPIIYRNFIEGVTPRGIAVGYPEKAHLAWDANRMCLTLIWHGRFIDAGKHWEGRGAGFQEPLGDHVMNLESTSPLALLESPATAWPAQPPRDAGYRFRSYELDAEGRPHFHYSAPTFAVVDFPKPIVQGKEPGFERRIKITSADVGGHLYFRAAAASRVEPQPDGSYLIDGNIRIRLPGAKPVLRESGGKQELLVPVVLQNGTAEIVQEILW